MTAVFAPQKTVLDLLHALDLPVTVANFNAPSQTVLSGEVAAIDTLEKELSKRKLDFRRLPVATAFHSPLVESAVLPFADFLQVLTVKNRLSRFTPTRRLRPIPRVITQSRRFWHNSLQTLSVLWKVLKPCMPMRAHLY